MIESDGAVAYNPHVEIALRLNSIAFAHGTKVYSNRISVAGLGRVRFHKQAIPSGRIGQFRIVKRASGWYACLFIQSEREPIAVLASDTIGVDSGFNHLLTLSNGMVYAHPRELEQGALRLAQAQRGRNKNLAARIQERVKNQRKDRNHKLSLQLASENQFIAFSADNHSGIAKRFGKSVSSSSHFQLRRMQLSGPSGLKGLRVRTWTCVHCGTEHDRDVNAAINTLRSGLEEATRCPARAA